VFVSWANVGDHDRLTVAGQRVFQETRQLRITIIYIPAIDELINNNTIGTLNKVQVGKHLSLVNVH